jgi:hypothetical protein
LTGTEGVAYRSPFGDFLALPAPRCTTITDTTPAAPVSPALPPASTPAPPRATTTVITPATAGRSVTSCVTTSPFGHPGCSGRDLARGAAGIGLALALLPFAGDALLLLRRRRVGAGS